MTVVVFTDGPLKGQGRDYPDLPQQVIQPVAQDGFKDHFLYEYEVDQYPFADGEAPEGTQPIYEAHQVMMWIAPRSIHNPTLCRDFKPGRADYHRVHFPDDAAHLSAFFKAFEALKEEWGVTHEACWCYEERGDRFEYGAAVGYRDGDIDFEEVKHTNTPVCMIPACGCEGTKHP